MNHILRRNINEIYDIISIYANRHHLNESIVEKDLWNCYFLDYLFNKSAYKDYFIFKGGTSLSKCYKLINRYSEDLDIVLDARIFGINLENIMSSLKSRNQKEKFIGKINEQSMDFIEKLLIPEMKIWCKNDIKKELIFELDRKSLSFYITYPHKSKYDYIAPKVKIEMSSLSAIIPTEEISIEPYIDEVLSSNYKVSFRVKCMMVDRTFWEKVLILHQESNRMNGDIPRKYSRHYYDLYQIYNSKLWPSIINDHKLIDNVREFTIAFYNRSWSNFEKAKPGSFTLVPNTQYLNELKKDYEAMSQMIFGSQPKFEVIIETIKIIEKEINKL